jgi:hypothetical protein
LNEAVEIVLAECNCAKPCPSVTTVQNNPSHSD